MLQQFAHFFFKTSPTVVDFTKVQGTPPLRPGHWPIFPPVNVPSPASAAHRSDGWGPSPQPCGSASPPLHLCCRASNWAFNWKQSNTWETFRIPLKQIEMSECIKMQERDRTSLFMSLQISSTWRVSRHDWYQCANISQTNPACLANELTQVLQIPIGPVQQGLNQRLDPRCAVCAVMPCDALWQLAFNPNISKLIPSLNMRLKVSSTAWVVRLNSVIARQATCGQETDFRGVDSWALPSLFHVRCKLKMLKIENENIFLLSPACYCYSVGYMQGLSYIFNILLHLCCGLI